MKVSVLLEKVGTETFRASTAQPVQLEAEGATRDEAIERLCFLARRRLEAAEVVQVSMPGLSGINPWRQYAGIWENHPDFQDYIEHISKYRSTIDDAPAAK